MTPPVSLRARSLLKEAVWRARTGLRVSRARMRSKASVEREFRARYFADEPVNLEALPQYKLERFPDCGPRPWLDAPDANEKIAERLARGEISAEQAAKCREWAASGALVLEKFFDDARLERMWSAYEDAVASRRVPLQPEQPATGDHLPSRSLDAHLVVPEVRAILHDPGLVAWMRLLLGREPIPFQTLVSHKGSEQREHSDAIHMTTYPVGYLTAAWIAFEDISPDCGPIVYYPGSHRLPYLSSRALGLPEDDFRKRGYSGYMEKYEPAIQALIAERGLARSVFLPKKGDVLLWHGNLIHAGSPRRNLALSRKAVVLHYFAQGAVCYHDLSGTRTPEDRLERPRGARV